MTAISRTRARTKLPFTAEVAGEDPAHLKPALRPALSIDRTAAGGEVFSTVEGELARGHFFVTPEQDFCGSEALDHTLEAEDSGNPIRFTDDGMTAAYDSTYLGIANMADNAMLGMSRSGGLALYGVFSAQAPGRRGK